MEQAFLLHSRAAHPPAMTAAGELLFSDVHLATAATAFAEMAHLGPADASVAGYVFGPRTLR